MVEKFYLISGEVFDEIRFINAVKDNEGNLEYFFELVSDDLRVTLAKRGFEDDPLLEKTS